MRIPEFTAEVSLYGTNGHYRTAIASSATTCSIRPAGDKRTRRRGDKRPLLPARLRRHWRLLLAESFDGANIGRRRGRWCAHWRRPP